MFDPINLSAFADPVLDALGSGPLQLDNTIFFDTIRQADGPVLEVATSCNPWSEHLND